MTNNWESSTTIGAHPSSRPSAGRTRPRNTFSARRIDDIEPPACVYALTGIFTDSKGAYEFLDRFRQELGDGRGAVVIDLTDVHHMTSCGVGILAAAYTSSLNAGRPMALAGMRRPVVSVMRVVGLLPVIPNYETREQALAATRFRGRAKTIGASTVESRVTDGVSP